MRLLVTGATGFIGMHLGLALVKEGYQVRVFVRKKTTLFPLTLEIEQYVGDVTNPEDILRAAKDCSGIFHLAAAVSFKKTDARLLAKVNVQGTKNVITAALKQKVHRLVHVSSASAIGNPTKEKKIMNETDNLIKKGNEGYPESKWISEELVRDACRTKKLNAVIVSPSTVYGAGGREQSAASLVQSLSHKRFILAPPGGCSIVTVDDVIQGLLLAYKKGETGEKYILTGENISYKKLFTLICKSVTGRHPCIMVLPYVLFYPAYAILHTLELLFESLSFFPSLLTSQVLYFIFHYRYLNNTKARTELGWQPKNDFTKAIQDMHSYSFTIVSRVRSPQATNSRNDMIK